MSDKIILKGIEVYGHHGCSIEEQKLGQKIIVDIEVDTDLSDACSSDEMGETVDYVKILECVEKVVGDESFKLLEGLAERIAEEVSHVILVESNLIVDGVKVTVHKPYPPVNFKVQDVSVEIYRE